MITEPKTNSRVLLKYWYPLVFEKDVPSDKPISVQLIGKKLVVYRTRESIVVAEDRCPHRGTSLSLGYVTDGNLTCTYHGLQFGTSGLCQNLQQRCSPRSREGLCLTTFPCKERYGIVWTCLDADSTYDIPDFPEYYDPSYCSLSLHPLEWSASPIRQIESVFDLTHFSHVHQASGCSMLGTTEEIPPYTTKKKGNTICVDFRAAAKNQFGFWARIYKITLPFTVHMSVQRTPNGYWTMFNTVCPISEEKSLIFVVQAFNFNKEPISDAMISYEELVYSEDQRVVESQTPVIPNLEFENEYSLPEDGLSIVYRKSLRGLGLN